MPCGPQWISLSKTVHMHGYTVACTHAPLRDADKLITCMAYHPICHNFFLRVALPYGQQMHSSPILPRGHITKHTAQSYAPRHCTDHHRRSAGPTSRLLVATSYACMPGAQHPCVWPNACRPDPQPGSLALGATCLTCPLIRDLGQL